MNNYEGLSSFICSKIFGGKNVDYVQFNVTRELVTLILKKYYDNQEITDENSDCMIIKLSNNDEAVLVGINGKNITFFNHGSKTKVLNEEEKEIASISTVHYKNEKYNTKGILKMGDVKYDFIVKGHEIYAADSYELKMTRNDETVLHSEYFSYGAKISSTSEMFDFICYDNKTGEPIKDNTSFLKKIVDNLRGEIHPNSTITLRTGYESDQIAHTSEIFESLEENTSVYYKSKEKNKSKDLV